jgi:hypothetical protein
MGSIMKRELVAVKPNETWDIILDISLSEGKNLTAEQAINIIRSNYSETSNAEFVIDGIDMFVLLDNMTTVNPGNGCKI